jgi:hypothetical protein
MQSYGVSAVSGSKGLCNLKNPTTPVTQYDNEARIDPSILDNFDQVDLSVAAINAAKLNAGNIFWNPVAETDHPNIVDNSAYFGIENMNGAQVTHVTFSVGKAVPRMTGVNSDGTPKMDWGDFGTEEAYNEYCENTNFSGSNSAFFHTSSDDFLLEAAKQYATISDTQEFKYRPTKDSAYVETAVNWFCGDKATDEDYQAMRDSIDKIVRELASQIKNGESPNLSTLKNKLSIGGNKISVSELESVKKTYYKLEKGVKDLSFGSASIVEFAMKGVRNAVASLYSNNLLGNSDTECAAGFKRLMDKSCESNLKVCREAYDTMSSEGRTSADLNSRSDPEIYELFSGLDTSSKANTISDFNKKLGTLDSILLNQFHMDKQYAKSYEQDVKDLFGTLINQI